jgi:pyruvate dehydrogenase E1 component
MSPELRPMVVDSDPVETNEWLESLDALLREQGPERAHFILTKLLRRAQVDHVDLPSLVQTPYVNTIPVDQAPPYPGDEAIEKRIRRYIRWNAVAMVMRANAANPGLGGHLSTYASAATLYEVGFNHFFRGNENGMGDLVYFQGHAAPGIYARAYLERRLDEKHLESFRRESMTEHGLSSYPHPRLMSDFWQFPTVSMGLGPISAIYQAFFNRYVHHRGLADTSQSRVWCFVGDGETDEPETLGALHLAARERLNNLTFVVNCNLQRLDGPVRGNGKIIQELEANFRGAGWRVIKVIWGRQWDPLLAADTTGQLVRVMGETVDGQYQKYTVEKGSYIREHFFGRHPALLRLVEHLSDDELWRLRRGGHSLQKVYAAYDKATKEESRPVVVLAKTVKGWTLGEGAEGRNSTHQQKKLSMQDLRLFRDRLHLNLSNKELEEPPFIRFAEGSEEFEYLMERRRILGGPLPKRSTSCAQVPAPAQDKFERYLQGSGTQEASTTGAFSRMLAGLLNDPQLGKRIVPIIPDEARTFGLDALFKRHGIYSSAGQLYEPVDAHMMLSYREAKDGQVIEAGICEAGSMAAFVAAGTAYSSIGEPMIPFYTFYSMFGFQRTADQIWAAGDQRCRGFLMGATAGRTTLNGEGLQHADGHSLLLADTQPHVIAYDPAYAYEIAIIIREGLRRMGEAQEDVIYYLTIHNEPYLMPAMREGIEKEILEGIYLLNPAPDTQVPLRAQLFGSGAILGEVLRAQKLLAEQFSVAADVWSVTSYGQLRREAIACDRANQIHAGDERGNGLRRPIICQRLEHAVGPVIATSDYSRSLPDSLSPWIEDLTSLGTDGFGRSDTRKALRRFFEVDAEHIAVATLHRLAMRNELDRSQVRRAIDELGLAEQTAYALNDLVF